MASIKCLTANVKGMADKIKRKQLFNYFLKKKLDIVFIQESHSTRNVCRIWRSEWAGEIVFSHGDSNARGVAILTAKNSGVKVISTQTDEDGRIIFCTTEYDGKKLLLCNCYAPNEDNPQFFEKIMEKLNTFSYDTCIWAGDFNKCLSDKEI